MQVPQHNMSLKPKNMETTTILAIVAVIAAVGAVTVVSGMSMLTADHSQLAYATRAMCSSGVLSSAACNNAATTSQSQTGSNNAGQ